MTTYRSDPGPVQAEYRVMAMGSTDAADKAKHLARASGYRICTVSRIDALGDPDPRTLAPWRVVLAVRQPR